jgi:hypothetical protein
VNALQTNRVAWPTVVHVTHWKAGSQWIYKILLGCVPDRIVPPQLEMAQVLDEAILPGGVYPTVYVTHEEFEQIKLRRMFVRSSSSATCAIPSSPFITASSSAIR